LHYRSRPLGTAFYLGFSDAHRDALRLRRDIDVVMRLY